MVAAAWRGDMDGGDSGVGVLGKREGQRMMSVEGSMREWENGEHERGMMRGKCE